jgi:DNA-repair protein XRCC2
MLINCVLPSELGGWGKVGILLDTDHKFPVMRFAQLLRARVGRLLPANHPDSDAIATKASSLLHVFRPSSSHQLAATIQHLPVYLATELPEEDLGILAIDSISAFYWPDRYAHEQLRSSDLRSANPLSHAFASITSFIQSHGPLVLLSSWDLNRLSASQWRQQLETSIPLPLTEGQHVRHQLPVTCRINLYHSGVEHPLEMGNGGITANTPTISSLSATIRAPGNSVAKRFTLQVTEDDILVS